MCSKTILFVEDDEDDRDLLSMAIQEINASAKLVFMENGLRALEYLNGVKQASQLPCLIVLDLNMPFLDGKETYQKIKEDLQLDEVPVVIFTSSSNPNDRELFSRQGVEFITKPDNFSMMNTIVVHMLDLCGKHPN